MTKLESLQKALHDVLGEKVSLVEALGEVTATVALADYYAVSKVLATHAELGFEMCMDLCGVDYSTYGDGVYEGRRFAVVLHLLSVTKNWRMRLKVYVEDDDFPVVPSLIEVWPAVNWYEREAFDCYGIIFEGHPDLRRILMDYGFIGYPFRKDFPLSGHVEMRYDEVAGRVVYQPVTIDPREITPRVIREEGYGAGR